MTIDARRENVRFLLPQLAFDHFAMDKLDFCVTLCAGRRNVSPRNGRGRVGVRQNGVSRMARNAAGRHNESLAEKPFTVNAFGEILDDMILVDGPLTRDGRPFLVAFAAQERDVERHNGRFPVAGLEYLVRSVTVFTVRGEGIAPFNSLTVKRFFVEGFFLVVARTAIHGLEILAVREFLSFKVFVAGNARQ